MAGSAFTGPPFKTIRVAKLKVPGFGCRYRTLLHPLLKPLSQAPKYLSGGQCHYLAIGALKRSPSVREEQRGLQQPARKEASFALVSFALPGYRLGESEVSAYALIIASGRGLVSCGGGS